MNYNAYEVGSKDWKENENNERLAWGLTGSTYGISMGIGYFDGDLLLEECLNSYRDFSYGGTIDTDSVGENPEAMYLVDVDQHGDSIDQFQGIEMWYPEVISDRHRKPNYLTFGGSVQKVSKEWLVKGAYLGEEPWYFEWSRGEND